MLLPVPITSSNSGGATRGVVRRRVIAPILEIAESGDVTRQDVVAHIDNQSSGYTPDQILVEALLVGGGGIGSASSELSTGVYGGFPGQVRRFESYLADLWHDDNDHLKVDVGASGGSTTIFFHFYETEDWSNRIEAAAGGMAPNADYYLGSILIARAQAGYRGPDVSALRDRLNVVSSGFSLMFGNPDGPGAGGAIFDDAGSLVWLPGGPANTANSELSIAGGYLNGMSGGDAVEGVFEGFGGGGAPGFVDPQQNPSGNGGNGGFPGGGGGPSNNDPSSPGEGGQGVIRFRFSVLEAVA